MTKKPQNWKTFWRNDDNNSQLVDVIYRVWSSDISAPKLVNRKVFQGHCFLSETKVGKVVKEIGIQNLLSNHQETDSRYVYDNVRIISPDSDVFLVLLHHAGKFDGNIQFDTGGGNKNAL